MKNSGLVAPGRNRVAGWPPRWLTERDGTRSRGGDAIEFIEAYCRVVKESVGGPVGSLIVLRPWQKELVLQLLATRPDGKLHHRQALVGMARKQGKSALMSSLALWALLLGDDGGEVYSIAGDREQARITFGTARRMIELDPELASQCRVYRDAIEVPSSGAVWRVLASEASLREGLSPTLTLVDEVHVLPEEMWNVFALAQGARKEPLMVGITTAGTLTDSLGQESLCYRLYKYGQQVAQGYVDDPTFFFAWWEPKQGAEADHHDPKVWAEANPGLGDIVALEDFESAVRRTPESEFRALDVDTPILTSSGWQTMGTVSVGDEVYAADGELTRVFGTSRIFEDRSCYEVRLEDGRTLIADADHEWAVEWYHPSRHRGSSRVRGKNEDARVVTTTQLIPPPPWTAYIPNAQPLHIPDAQLPIDPYVFGYWLGDGDRGGPTLAVGVEDLDPLLVQLDAVGYFHVVRKGEDGTRHVYVSTSPIIRSGLRRDTLRARLIALEVHQNKHVPDTYLRSSIEQRLALLQGLMDSDGTALPGSAVRFTNTNRSLVDAVAFLARSLGWKPAVTEKKNRFGPFWNVQWTARTQFPVFRLQRKQGKLDSPLVQESNRHRRAKVVSVVAVASRPTRCLAVEHPSHLFLAGHGLVATHNTKRTNVFVAGMQTWLPHGAWDACAVERTLKDGEECVLGFDGSWAGDSTALVACTVDGFVDVVGAWERPANSEGWRVDIEAVEAAIREACKRYSVREVVCDPYRWQRTMQALESEGIPIVEWPTGSPARMVPATARFGEAVLEHRLTHNGNGVLARHVANCVLKTDRLGPRIVKESKMSARKIDAAVACTIAYDRATQLPVVDDRGPMIW